MLTPENRGKLYKLSFDKSPIAIVILDRNGHIVDVNDRLFDWLGYKPEEVAGKNILKLPYITRKGKAIIARNFAKRMAGKELEPYEIDFIPKNGDKRIGRIVAAVIRDDKSKIAGEIVTISDVTREKENIEELERMNDLLVERELRMIELKNKIKELEK